MKISPANLLGTAVLACALSFSPSMYSQSPMPQASGPVVIRYFSGVNPESVNWLLGSVDSQLKQGRTQIIILISSPGGDVLSGFTAYNYLKGIQAEVTTINIGSVDSAATVLFCAGKKRYSVPEARFLFHGVSANLQANQSIDANLMSATLEQLKSQNQMLQEVVATTTGKPLSEVKSLTDSQTIVTPEMAKTMRLIQEITSNLVPAGATIATDYIPAPVGPPTPAVAPAPVFRFGEGMPQISAQQTTSQ